MEITQSIPQAWGWTQGHAAADVSPKGASVRPAKGEALVQRCHQKTFSFPVTSGPTGQEFILSMMT